MKARIAGWADWCWTNASPHIDRWLAPLAAAVLVSALAAAIFAGASFAIALFLLLVGVLASASFYRGLGWDQERSRSSALRNALSMLEARNAGLRARALYEDPHLGLGNYALLRLEWAKAAGRYERAAEPFSLVFFALERSGPGAVQTAVARQVGASLFFGARPEDAVCSLGEGRFAVLLADTGIEGARAFAHRMRRFILSRPASAGGRQLWPRVGSGYSAWQESMNDLDELLEAAVADWASPGGRRQPGDVQAAAVIPPVAVEARFHDRRRSA
jgi:GGDEF domain-containing protein